MALICLVQQVVSDDVEPCDGLALDLYVCAGRDAQQGICRCRCLRAVGAVYVCLAQVVVQPGCEVEVVQQRTAMP